MSARQLEETEPTTLRSSHHFVPVAMAQTPIRPPAKFWLSTQVTCQSGSAAPSCHTLTRTSVWMARVSIRNLKRYQVLALGVMPVPSPWQSAVPWWLTWNSGVPLNRRIR